MAALPPYRRTPDRRRHTNMQQYNSFQELFVNALKPGGVYVIEDLQVCGVVCSGTGAVAARPLRVRQVAACTRGCQAVPRA